jgi:hypothetical protein
LWKKNLEEAFDHGPAGDMFTKKMANVFAKSIKELFLTSEAQKIDILFNDLFKMANVFAKSIKELFLTSEAQKIDILFNPCSKKLEMLNKTEEQEFLWIIQSVKYTSDGNNMLKEQCERLKPENMTNFLAMRYGISRF